jgi:spore germination cell wall hydrolase CwlJ-like protein
MLMQTREAALAPAEPRRPAPLYLRIVIALLALVAVAVPVLLVSNTQRTVVHKRPPVVISKRVVPKQELPPVDPLKLQEVAPDDARAINAAIPFSTLPNPAARAFHLSGAADSQARAVDCLAAAGYYEAGDDAKGQRAVVQVIINRMRHPAFPKTICGVVFQGSERSTGCQFTFTCDGAILRYSPSPAAWQRARDVARAALDGSVYRAVGHATHYHTNWVVPYWSASLEKITAVDTHLFFRWTGWWGTPPAFTRGYAGVEPNVPQMARLSNAHQGDTTNPLEAALQGDGSLIDPATIPDSAVPNPVGAGLDANHFLVVLDKKMNADAFAALAIKTCGERLYCKFMAWTDPKQKPAKLPATPAQTAAMSFSYLRDQAQGYAKALWNCGQFKRPSPLQCMRVQPPALAPVATVQPGAAATPLPDTKSAVAGPAPLTGVRRKTDPAPAAPKPQISLSLPVVNATPAPRPAESH